MNLLAVGAAYDAVVAVCQWGWFADVVGAQTGPIESFAPMMLFAELFGLSMDYEVFLLSRVREEYLRTGEAGQAVADGIAATASRRRRGSSRQPRRSWWWCSAASCCTRSAWSTCSASDSRSR